MPGAARRQLRQRDAYKHAYPALSPNAVFPLQCDVVEPYLSPLYTPCSPLQPHTHHTNTPRNIFVKLTPLHHHHHPQREVMPSIP